MALILVGAGILAANRFDDVSEDRQAELSFSYNGPDLNADQTKKTHALQIISSFENSTTVLQYGYAQVLDDGRGITAGRAGFTSGTHDLLLVIQRYGVLQPGNTLSRYIPALQAIDGTASLDGLEGLAEEWKSTADSDPLFRQAQDDVFDDLYFSDALEIAHKYHVVTPLGQLVLLDTAVQQGTGTDADGLPTLAREVESQHGQIGKTIDEAQWIALFLDVRKKHLLHAADRETRDAWKESVDRVAALRSLLASKEFALDAPIAWKVYGDSFKIEP